MSDDRPLVLVVEDESDLADLYAAWLGDGYRVRTAYGGREALENLDAEVDIVLLDRRMPGLSGDDVLDAMQDRGLDCQVAMVTAVEPDFDVLEMGFDDYLVKPVARDELLETVENLERRGTYDSGVQELFSLASKKALLEAEKTESELDENEEYGELTDRLEALREELDATINEMGSGDEFETLFREFDDVDGQFADEERSEDPFADESEEDPFGGVQE
ncbi:MULTISPECIES: HalX domain-containing protein [Halolamina]|uniref:Response regulator receiver domain-containing protein n=1 Tax=Halolamina pelagica TaxID=699431 RepID=A0A1I5MIK8_9EURY|nr:MULTISPECIES: HalX domain-containing protein [Halolamina]NHX36020.1 response regulator [Halolamina sp. R1-12]SFP08786.1 Response regulator receiver domain-containing protein [Halolamina pelagica]